MFKIRGVRELIGSLEQFEITRVLSGQSADVMDQFLRDAESAISDIDPPPTETGSSR